MSDEQEIKQAEEKKKEENERLLRAVTAMKEINSILQKYNCKTDVYLTLGSDGSMRGEVKVIAR